MKAPFVVYANFECLLQPTNKPKKPHQHIPYSVGYYFQCAYDIELSYYRDYRGEDCVKWLVRELHNLAEDVETVYQCPTPIDKLSSEQFRQFYIRLLRVTFVKILLD